MKRGLPALALCLATCLSLGAAWPLHAQDNGGGGDAGSAGNGGSGDSGGITPAPGANALGGGNSSAPAQDQTGNTTPANPPASGAGESNSGGNTPGSSSLLTPPGSESPSEITPGPAAGLPSFLTPLPATTGASPPSGDNALTGGVISAPLPISLSLPGGYGASEKTFTLGEGRLSKPPILFSLTLSQGFDDNILSSPTVAARRAITAEVQPPAQQQFLGFRHIISLSGMVINVPIISTVLPKKQTVVLAPANPGEKPLASPVTTANLGVQIQKADPRTIFTLDGALGILDYWKEKDLQYTGSLGVDMVHRLTPRATVSASVDAVYQNQPDFSRINTPTANVNGSYLNGDGKINFTYAWTPRFSSVTTYDIGITTQNNSNGGNLVVNTYGNQFRYALSARNTATLELRQSQSTYASAPQSNSTDTFLLVGLDSMLSPRLRTTFSTGEELGSFDSGGSTALPYLESSTSLDLPRGGLLQWTNRYGLENSNNTSGSTTSFRTGLSLSEPLGAKLSASLSLAYNYLQIKDRITSVNSGNQTQFQASASLQYLVSPRLSFSLSYTLLNYLASTPDSNYRRNQVFLGVTYTF